MAANQEYINGLVRDPREQIVVEVKRWIDPRSEHGKAKIVRAMIALRNQNGGFFVVGFEDGTWAPDVSNTPADVRSEWDADEVQGLVTKHASEPFEVHLRFAERDGQEYPVLEVEAGVRSPVAAKKEIADPSDGDKKLVRLHAVYARTLRSNGAVSSSEIHHADWPELARRCSDNREADIGRFLRRQLERPEIGMLAQTAASVYETMPQPEPTGVVRAEYFRRDGYERFQQEKQRRELLYMPRHGSWEATVVLEGGIDPPNLDQDLLNLINASNPRYTGWPVWIDSRGFVNADGTPDRQAAPYTFDGGWEAFISNLEEGGMRRRLDFWRIEPAGRFYLYRAFQDDLATGPQAPEPMRELDFVLPILRTAEAMAVAMAFAKAMGASPEEASLHHAFRWDGLGGRELSAWARSSRESARYGRVELDHVSRQQYAEALVSIPLDAPASVLGRYVREATAPLYSAFSGFALEPGFVEDLTDRLLSRRF